ncbi:MAG TPA: gamma-glutamyltransferase [Verrucomicrobiales bacterium]|nr:gamma-glutamyltransferase [Verrucomicrobiales bacterium]
MRALFFILAISFMSSADPAAPIRARISPWATRSETIAPHGMVCTSHPLATQAGLEVLRAGGSAVDAAIAANACLGLMEPVSCGIGGDLFALVWDPATRKLHGLNASGRSPYDMSLEDLQARNLKFIPSYGPLPVTVPGCVDGWFRLHEKFGRLPMRTNLTAAIGYARDGFPVSEVIARAWASNVVLISKYPNVLELYAPGGATPRKGQRFQNPQLAATYEQLATGGRDAFYRGRIAQTIVAFHRAQGGSLSERDFADHTSNWVEPISTTYRGYEVWELPPNGQGLAVLQMLNILEGFDLRAAGFGSVEHLHWLIEAKKLAFADRARLYADPDFFRTPIAELNSKSYAAQRRALINATQPAGHLDPGLPALRTSDTIYLCVADERGMMVSLIQSNYRGMGSGMVPPGLGFALQDRGEAFDLTPERPNSYAPHKRPFHTIIPAFVTRDGEPLMAFGLMGGDMQPQGHVQILLNLFDFGMGLQEAGDAPRVYHTGSVDPDGSELTPAGTVNLEATFAPEVRAELERRGHRLGFAGTPSYGGYQAVMWDRTNRVWVGASESRKDGQASGY